MDRMKRKIVGVALTAFGLGMLIARFIPLWGMIAAVVIAAAGIFLLMGNDC